ncbi:hypothetical protein O9992_24645 [Vibrio lentus]|nr:hypothetical protein [Vibrio lentus]
MRSAIAHHTKRAPNSSHLGRHFILSQHSPRTYASAFSQSQHTKVTGGLHLALCWMQMLADLTGMTVEISDVDETQCIRCRNIGLWSAQVGSSLARMYSSHREEFYVTCRAES